MCECMCMFSFRFGKSLISFCTCTASVNNTNLCQAARVLPLRRQFHHPQKYYYTQRMESIHKTFTMPVSLSIEYQLNYTVVIHNISHSMWNLPSKDFTVGTHSICLTAICFSIYRQATHTQKQPRLRVNNAQRTRLYLHITHSPPISLISEEKRWIKQRKTAGNGDQWILLNCMPPRVLCLVGVCNREDVFPCQKSTLFILFIKRSACAVNLLSYADSENHISTLLKIRTSCPLTSLESISKWISKTNILSWYSK